MHTHIETVVSKKIPAGIHSQIGNAIRLWEQQSPYPSHSISTSIVVTDGLAFANNSIDANDVVILISAKKRLPKNVAAGVIVARVEEVKKKLKDVLSLASPEHGIKGRKAHLARKRSSS